MEARKLNPGQEQLIMGNIKLVYKMIAEVSKERGIDFKKDFEDAKTAGTIGLVKAATRFDETRGAFSTLACTCIGNEIYGYLRTRYPPVVSLDKEYEGGDIAEILFNNIIDVRGRKKLDDLMVDRDILSRIVSIILNCLPTRKKVIVLYKIAGITNKKIGQQLEFSTTRAGQIQQEGFQTIRKLFKDEKTKYKGAFQVEVTDLITITFCGVIRFREALNSLISEVKSYPLGEPGYPGVRIKYLYDNDKVKLSIPIDWGYFYVLGRIIEEMEGVC